MKITGPKKQDLTYSLWRWSWPSLPFPKCCYWEHERCPTWEIHSLFISAPLLSVIWYEECCFLATSHFRSFAFSALKMDIKCHYKDISPWQNSSKTLFQLDCTWLQLKIWKRKDITSRIVFSNLLSRLFRTLDPFEERQKESLVDLPAHEVIFIWIFII